MNNDENNYLKMIKTNLGEISFFLMIIAICQIAGCVNGCQVEKSYGVITNATSTISK